MQLINIDAHDDNVETQRQDNLSRAIAEAQPAVPQWSGENPNIEFPGPPYWLPLVPLTRKYPGRHPLCQYAAGRPLTIVEASRCITSRCIEVFGLDMSPVLSHLPPMARVVKYSTAPASFVLGGLDDLQVSVEDYREITGFPAKRVKVVDLVRYDCVDTEYEPVGPCQAIPVKDNAIFDLIEEWPSTILLAVVIGTFSVCMMMSGLS
ncbi:hypothetical protein F5Y07DRAFT_407445 [Xylaria sp. FL0933]|nr:hypothetical protein F5Y07DRAFT_407445 [Xylaria sp. FL0933]